MREVVLSIRKPETWIKKIVEKFSASVRVIDCRPSKEAGIQQLVEINAPHNMLEQIVDCIKTDENVKDAHLVKTKRGLILGAVTTRDSTMCKTMSDLDCFCLTCPLASPNKSNGTVEWVLTMTKEHSLHQLLGKLKNDGVAADVIRVSRVTDGEKLTPRQRRVIEDIFVAGFFEYPRRAGLQGLSRSLGISASTLGETIRRAERKIITNYLHSTT